MPRSRDDPHARTTQQDIVQSGSSRRDPALPGWRPSRRTKTLATGLATILTAAAVAIALTTGPAGHRRSGPRGVTLTEAGHPLLGVRANWDLLGLAASQVIRIEPATGRIVSTTIPGPQNSPVTFIADAQQAIVRPLDNIPGYLVAGGLPARRLSGTLRNGGVAVPGPEPGQVWVQAGYGSRALVLAGLNGAPAGAAIALPTGGPWEVSPDGSGYVLLTNGFPEAWYDARPGVLRRIPGTMIAAGPGQILTLSCHRGHCRDLVINPATGAQRILPGAITESIADPPMTQGVIAPDHARAAVFGISATAQPALYLLNLISGTGRRVHIPLGNAGPGPQPAAWSPDSRWLFVLSARGAVLAINPATGRATALSVRLPPLTELAVAG